MNISEIPFTEDLLLHIKTYFKVPATIQNNSLVCNEDDAQKFFNFFTKNNIKLDLKVCASLMNLFKYIDFKIYFQRKNRVIIILNETQLFVHGQKIYAEMAHNHLIQYINWDNNCTDINMSRKEIENLNELCKKENIAYNQCLSEKSKKLLLEFLENTDGIELVNITKEGSNKIQSSDIIDLSLDDDDELQCIDLTDSNERQIILSDTDKKRTNIKLRPVILDGSNIAFSHGCGDFNPKGVDIAVNYFITRGHDSVYVLVPRHRQLEGGQIFHNLEKSKHLIYTPSRIINNKRETSYDDKLILEAALGHNGVVISNDQYRDLFHIQKFRDIIINRLIPYTFVGDLFMIPDDPKGQLGPNLRTMLSISPRPKSEIKIAKRTKACSKLSLKFKKTISNKKLGKKLKPLKRFYQKH